MEPIREVYVVLENKPGTAGQMFRVLKKKRISVYAVAMFIDFARLVVSDADKAVAALQEHGYQVESRTVLRVQLVNRAGALMEFTQKLGNAGINIDYLYGSLHEKEKKGTIIVEVDQPELAMKLFENDKLVESKQA
ncbi:MAG: hypothetical protein D6681_12595 [Calditrichaeota bacterium]|nr:MAG: hypothetical protein D6681_12595 [Calditrichota bacterium]